MRILIKISGEALNRGKPYSIDHEYVRLLCSQIHQLVAQWIEVAIVCWGGNICRWEFFAEHGISANTSHETGMLSTVINWLIIQDCLISSGQKTNLYTAKEIQTIGEVFHSRKAVKNLSDKKIVIIAWGTGNPYFTTDTASVLRSIELWCDMMIKCTSVDGIYSSDPKKDSTAIKYESINYNEVLTKNLRVMDQTAIALAREHCLKIGVCHIDTLPSLNLLLEGKFQGSIITDL